MSGDSQYVTMTVCDRPWYLETTLESWSQVHGIENAFLSFRCEPGNDMAIDMCRNWRYSESEVHINPAKLGVLTNPWSAFEAGFAHHEFVILAEEDVVVAPDVLFYFGAVEGGFRAHPDVLIACAFNINGCDDPAEYHRVQTQPNMSPLVWGTWKDRWESTLRDTWDHDYSSGVPGGWDWNLNLRVLPPRFKCVAPRLSRSQHIGIEGRHCHAFMFEETQALTFAGDLDLDPKPFDLALMEPL